MGKTVFTGNRVEDFDVEILGVLENFGPRQSLILGKLSGGPLQHTGVMQGMSGSPVYVDGKLIGAVALAFPFSKDPIAGIRPIEEMIAVSRNASPPVRTAAQDERNLLASLPPHNAGPNGMVEIATPIAFGGFTQRTLDYFGPQLQTLGLQPRQGVGSGGKVGDQMGDPSALHPGSMISVQLMNGDLNVGADGTVTYIDGKEIYAFGHRFLDIGPTGLPFTRAEVLTLLPNVNSSFKISAAKELMGVISQDRSTAIAGQLGKRADLVPVSITMAHSGRTADTYRMEMVNDGYLSPILLQMAVFSAIDGTERTVGASSLSVDGEIELENRPALKIRNLYAGEGGLPVQASLAAAIPLAYILQPNFPGLRVKGIHLTIDSADTRKQWQIEDVSLSRRQIRPGETVELTARLSSDNGAEITRSVRYQVPASTAPGTLFFSVADGLQTSLTELRASSAATARTPEQLLAAVNKLRANDKAYVRVWRADPDFQLSGDDLPNPPPSVAMVLSANSANQQVRNSKIADLALDANGILVSGAKTVQLEVKN